jgi:hypothetical protein
MPLQVRLVPETHEGTCDVCGVGRATVMRFFVEVDEAHADTPWVCVSCLSKPVQTTLVEPPAYKGGPPSRRLRKRIRREERETAEMVGGYAQKASGALLSAKGDIRVKGKLRGEEKSTEKKSFILKREVLDKIRGECVGTERPFVMIRFRNPTTLATEDQWVVLPVEDWEHAKNATSQHQ